MDSHHHSRIQNPVSYCWTTWQFEKILVLPPGFAPGPRPHLGLTDHKSAVLLLHHRRRLLEPHLGLAPSSPAYKADASLSTLARHLKSGGRRRACTPGRFPGPIRFQGGPGPLVRFVFHKEKSGLRRTCSPDAGRRLVPTLFQRAPVRSPGSQSKRSPPGRICTCTQHFAAADFKSAASAYSGHEGARWSLRQELHLQHPAYETGVPLFELRSEKLEPRRGFAPRSADYESATSLSMLARQNWRKSEGMLPRPVVPARSH